MTRRVERLNSLLKEVIAEVIREEFSNMLTVTRVEITADLHYAKVYITFIGKSEKKEEMLKTLQDSAGMIAMLSSKKVVMRYFPALTFYFDNFVETHSKIDKILEDIKQKHKASNEP